MLAIVSTCYKFNNLYSIFRVMILHRARPYIDPISHWDTISTEFISHRDLISKGILYHIGTLYQVEILYHVRTL